MVGGWHVLARPACCSSLSSALAGPSKRMLHSGSRQPIALQRRRLPSKLQARSQINQIAWPSVDHQLALFSTSSRRAVPPPSQPKPPSPPSSTPPTTSETLNTDVATKAVPAKKQLWTDLAILRQLAANVWPKGNNGVKIRVVTAVSLLIAGKVLNVQVPFLFKSIVDGMNVPITDESTIWVLAGASIAGCEYTSDMVLTVRWSSPTVLHSVWRTA